MSTIMAVVPAASDAQVEQHSIRFQSTDNKMVCRFILFQVNENFIKACRDGDINKFNELVSRADVNYVSESGG